LKQADRSVVRRVVLAGRLSTYHEIVAQVAILNRNPPTSWVPCGVLQHCIGWMLRMRRNISAPTRPVAAPGLKVPFTAAYSP